MSELTKQSVFDTVVKHFKKQKVRAWDEGQALCAYRASDGKQCAVGCLFTDEEYKPIMEGHAVDSLFNENLLPVRFLPLIEPNKLYHGILGRLQSIHDAACDDLLTLTTSASLKNLAYEYKLNDSEVDW